MSDEKKNVKITSTKQTGGITAQNVIVEPQHGQDDRKLGQVKQTIREAAHAGLILRNQTPSSKDAEKWRDNTALLIKRFAGEPANFDFINCTEGAGKIDLTTREGIRAYLYIHANHLKELAHTMNATDLIEVD